MRIASLLSQQRILGGAAVLAATQFLASLAGLFRDRMLATAFPGLDVVDVYIASFRPSDLLFQITVMSAFSVALVPFLAQYHARGNRREMDRLLGGMMGTAAILFGAIALVAALFIDVLAPVLVGFTGASRDLYVNFARLALLSNALFVFGNALGQYLITVQRYWIYGLTPVLYTVGTIAGTIWLTPAVGPYGPMVGTLLGAVVYVILRAVAVIGAGGRLRFSLYHPDVLKIGWLMLPRVLALGAFQLELLLFDSLASRLPAGAVTVNAYTRNFQSVVVGVVGIALAQSTFSLLSQTASRGEWGRYRLYLRKGTVMMLVLTIPGAVALALLAPVAAWLVHLSAILPVFAVCLTLYALSIPFESLSHLLFRAFYATKSSAIPAAMSVLGGVTAIITAWMFADRFGVYALAFGFTVGQVVTTLGLALLLPRRIKLA